jgi:hypothetical protein
MSECPLDISQLTKDAIDLITNKKKFVTYKSYFEDEFLEKLDRELTFIEMMEKHKESILVNQLYYKGKPIN